MSEALTIAVRTQPVTPVAHSYAGSRVRSFMFIAKIHSVLWRRRAAKLDIGGLWPNFGNYLCAEETSAALNEGRSTSAEHDYKESIGNNDEDDLDPDGEDDDGGDGDWDSEDHELDHDDSAYGSAQAEFSREAHPELEV
ncbi:hypothetical protein FOXG_16012 [Fusarium oxysporum f. sp. lycopersici 4287]|uniref:Uncharacterized protein n=2 Tax=Fusarium oxysporum TaxID=5507 RepID=A0A0J9W454_FUSO4|nr:hypothetical protein FOXG_15554 [Fusarium oxysporum f. sp. lycopersici 4287]XP_018256367.1 uncharacterized protein FOXG_16012 [Fusarium oxysporum f. sp. lycopersici 4287]KNB17809.1 hypothetical protein FOXG_15554 [Fusarium oxysporum f. sp. lycopersici 4287]KNB18322.1 hypothetical protein FOXG_16012 [Fusarium oxysporum f. sp. lycopersici 4287]